MAFDTNTVAAPTTFSETPDSVVVTPIANEPTVLTDTFGAAANEPVAAQQAPDLGSQFEVVALAPPPAPEPVSHPAVGPISFQVEADPQPELPQLQQDFSVGAPQPDITVTSQMTHDDGVSTIVTNPNLAYDVQLTGEDLEANAPVVVAPVAEVFDTLFGSTPEVAEVLPEREIQVIQPVPEQQLPVQTAWQQKQDSTFDMNGLG